MDITIYLALWVILNGLIGAAIGDAKGRPGEGFVFGALLSVIGWIIIGCGKDYSEKKEK